MSCTKSPGTSVAHLNVNGLESKTYLVETEMNYYDVIAITETHLNSRVKNEDILTEGFKEPYRKDRTDNTREGVAVYVKNDIISKHRTDIDIYGLEDLWVEINNINCEFN